jgi:carbonic anhydrase
MDGRVQLPVINYLRKYFNVEYVDSITEPGPNLILAEQKPTWLFQSILNRIKISIEKHKSKGIAIVGHYDCAGNPSSEEDQLEHIGKAIQVLRQKYENMKIVGLWVDDTWQIHELEEYKTKRVTMR